MLLVRVLSRTVGHAARTCTNAAKMLPKNCRVIGVLVTMTTLLLAWLLASRCHSRLPTPLMKPAPNPGPDRYVQVIIMCYQITSYW